MKCTILVINLHYLTVVAHVNVTQRTLKTSPLTPPVDAFNEIGLQIHAKIPVLCVDVWQFSHICLCLKGCI